MRDAERPKGGWASISPFLGMSRAESSAMPYLIESDLAKLGMSKVSSSEIARAQESYVAGLFARCPRWRWLKKRRLHLSLARAEAIRELIERKP